MSKGLNKGLILKKDCLLSGWFIYKLVKKYIKNVLGVGVKKIKVISGFEIEMEVGLKSFFSIMLFLQKHSILQLKSLMDIICYDTLRSKGRFCIVYSLLSVRFNIRMYL